MARQYQVGAMSRAINGVFRAMTALGVGASYRRILTVKGRKTGKSYSTPVDVMDRGGDLWLVAPYGQVNWVKNARAAGVVTLKRGRHTNRFEVHETDPSEATEVLRQYMVQVPVTRPYFDAAPDAPDDQIAAELPWTPSVPPDSSGVTFQERSSLTTCSNPSRSWRSSPCFGPSLSRRSRASRAGTIGRSQRPVWGRASVAGAGEERAGLCLCGACGRTAPLLWAPLWRTLRLGALRGGNDGSIA